MGFDKKSGVSATEATERFKLAVGVIRAVLSRFAIGDWSEKRLRL